MTVATDSTTPTAEASGSVAVAAPSGGRPGQPELLTTWANIADLRPHPRNARNGDTDVIAESLQANHQYRPIVVARGGVILAGNHTYAAAMELGWTTIAAVHLDLDPASPEAIRIMLADNRTADMGRYDEALLLDLLRALDGELEGTGYTDDDLNHLAEVLDELPPIDGGDGGAFDETLLWPFVRVRLAPPLYEAFQKMPGDDDAERLVNLIQQHLGD